MKKHRHLATLALVVLLSGCVTGQKTVRNNGSSSASTRQIEDIPPAKADKMGYIRSPFAPDAGLIDVRGYAKGQEIRDPYTQKVFTLQKDYSHLPPPAGG